MYKSASLVLIAFAIANLTRADEPSLPTTELKVYRVGDVVSADAINGCGSWGETSSKEWRSEYAATLDALGELESFVNAMCSQKPAAVRAYSPTLSLMVRHTPDGHREIEQLLAAMRIDDPFSIRLECRALPGDPSEIKLLSITENEEKRLASLLINARPTKEQAAELRELIPNDVARMHIVDLKSGRRTPWGDAMFGPLTATGRVDDASGFAQIRIDYLANDNPDLNPFGSRLLTLADGESEIIHQYFDGGHLAWLVTASVPKQSQDIAPQQPE